MIKVSILVPICNVEKYLSQCLSSLACQTLKELEIICINDGSSDKSLEIIKKFRNQDNKIILIDKPNSGYGDSMNKGLQIAKGEYVGIVESDDFVEPDMFEVLYKIASNTKCDIVRGLYWLYWDEKGDKRTRFFNDIYGKVFNPLENKKIFLEAPAIWSAIYKRSFLNEHDISFLPTPGASYQDTSFFFKTLLMAQKMYVVPEFLLHYRQDNMGSSVKQVSLSKASLIHREIEEINVFLQKKQHMFNDIQSVINSREINICLWNLKRISIKDSIIYKDRVKKFLEPIMDNEKYENQLLSNIDKILFFLIKINNNFLLKLFLLLYKKGKLFYHE